MTDSEAKYVFAHYGYLMSIHEKAAFKHLSATMKAMHGKSDETAQEFARERGMVRGFFSSDPEVLRLVKDGYDPFVRNTAKRILRENAETVKFNLCPKCGRLARTPRAKQCRSCGHDWHSAES